MSSHLIFSEFKSFELNVSVFVICHCFNFSTFSIFQYEAEFFCFQLTTFEFLREVEVHRNWNTHNTFLSWFFWFFNSLVIWIVYVNDLACCIFDIDTIFNRCFDCCRDIKFIVTIELEFSCVDDAVFIYKFCFRSCTDFTVFNFNIELRSYICTSYAIVNFNAICSHI